MTQHPFVPTFCALFEDASDAVFVLEPATGRVLQANRCADELTGMDRLEGENASQLFRSDVAEDWTSFLALSDEGSLSFRGNLEMKARYGEEWLSVRVNLQALPVDLPGEQTPRVLLARDLRNLDPREHRQAERALLASEERYRLLFERNLAGVFRSSTEGTMFDCNESFVRMLGFTSREEALRSRTPDLYFDPGERARLLARLRENPVLTNFELRMRRRDGSPMWVLENVSLLANQDGKAILEATIVDIDERMKTEQALKVSEARYRTLIESLEQSIFLKDRDLRFLAANRNYCTILGCTEAELRAKTDFDFFPREVAQRYRADDYQVLQHGRHVQTEERRIHNRQTRIYRSVKTPVLDEAGQIVGVLGILWDVTDQLSLETQLRHVQKMDAIGQLAGGVAHDFNNLLTVILGNLSYVLSRNLATDEALELLRNGELAGMRAAKMTQRLLSFARRAALRAEPYSLNVAVEEAVQFLRPTIDPRIELEMLLEPELWPVKADTGLINQLLMNLAINARDALPQGGKVLFQTANFVPDAEYLRLHLEARPGEFAQLRVQDNGHGMTHDVRQRIFEPFFTTKEIGKGTGLGLATAFSIVRQHGGWIVCESQANAGAIFDVFLPRHVPPVAATADRSAAMPLATGTETLLFVDDEPMVRNLACLVLRKSGYKVLLAEDGRHALDVYEQRGREVDLIVLDGTMPRLSGRDTLRELVRLNPEVRVLFSSGYTAEHLDLADFPQVAGFMHKPYRVEDLAAKVRSILDRK